MLNELLTVVILPMLGLSAVLCGWRALRGPTMADRVVGLEMLTTLGIGVAACAVVLTDQPELIDVGLVLGLVAFLGALTFARVLERRT